MSDNIVLTILCFDPDYEDVALVLPGEKTIGDYKMGKDEYLGVEFWQCMYIRYNSNKTLEMFSIDAGQERVMEDLLSCGFDEKIKGMYDIPEWKLFGLTAGEVILHAYLKAYGNYKKEWLKQELEMGI